MDLNKNVGYICLLVSKPLKVLTPVPYRQRTDESLTDFQYHQNFMGLDTVGVQRAHTIMMRKRGE